MASVPSEGEKESGMVEDRWEQGAGGARRRVGRASGPCLLGRPTSRLRGKAGEDRGDWTRLAADHVGEREKTGKRRCMVECERVRASERQSTRTRRREKREETSARLGEERGRRERRERGVDSERAGGDGARAGRGERSPRNTLLRCCCRQITREERWMRRERGRCGAEG